MSETLILVGGIAWALIVITTVGYSSVLLGAKRWEAGLVGFACSVMLVVLGVVVIQNAPYIAQAWWS